MTESRAHAKTSMKKSSSSLSRLDYPINTRGVRSRNDIQDGANGNNEHTACDPLARGFASRNQYYFQFSRSLSRSFIFASLSLRTARRECTFHSAVLVSGSARVTPPLVRATEWELRQGNK